MKWFKKKNADDSADKKALLAKSGGNGADSAQGRKAIGAMKLQKRAAGSGETKSRVVEEHVPSPSAQTATKMPKGAGSVEARVAVMRQPTPEEIQSAAEHFSQAETLMAQADGTRALELYTRAVDQDPTQLPYQVGQVWATYVAGLSQATDCRRRLEKLLRQVDAGELPFKSSIFVQLGKLAMANGDLAEARSRFEDAKRADPGNREARDELEAVLRDRSAWMGDVKAWFARLLGG